MQTFEATAVESNIRVEADDMGQVSIEGAGTEAVLFILALQADDLAVVREGWSGSFGKMMAPKALGQEIADRVAHVVRKLVDGRLLVYSVESGTWELDYPRVRQRLGA